MIEPIPGTDKPLDPDRAFRAGRTIEALERLGVRLGATQRELFRRPRTRSQTYSRRRCSDATSFTKSAAEENRLSGIANRR